MGRSIGPRDSETRSSGGARKARSKGVTSTSRTVKERRTALSSISKERGIGLSAWKDDRTRSIIEIEMLSDDREIRFTSYGGVESVQIGEGQRDRSKVHHYFVGPSRFAVSALVSRHEYTGVTSSYVETARVVQRELERAVQSALDRSLHANVQLSLPQFLHLPGKYILGLMNFLQKDGVVPDSGG